MDPPASRDHGCCSSCHLVLKQPFIECKTCKTGENICLECFSKGKEFSKHKKTHRYVIVQDDFDVLESNWTASEGKYFTLLLLRFFSAFLFA